MSHWGRVYEHTWRIASSRKMVRSKMAYCGGKASDTKEEGLTLVHGVKGLSLSLRRQSRTVPWYWEHEMEHLTWQLFQE